MKPADFFLGVVNFLGVLVPGAVLLFLRSFQPTAWSLTKSPIPEWLIFAGIAYLIGQFLLAVTEIFNEAVPYFKWGIFRHLQHDLDAFRKKASERLALVESDSDQSKFHTALSYLRLKNQAASGEVDHNMADYKLLRNLVVVLAIDSAMRAFAKPHQYRVVGIELVLVVVCIVAFVRMYNWAQLLAFQYVCLMPPDSPSPDHRAKNPARNDARNE